MFDPTETRTKIDSESLSNLHSMLLLFLFVVAKIDVNSIDFLSMLTPWPNNSPCILHWEKSTQRTTTDSPSVHLTVLVSHIISPCIHPPEWNYSAISMESITQGLFFIILSVWSLLATGGKMKFHSTHTICIEPPLVLVLCWIIPLTVGGGAATIFLAPSHRWHINGWHFTWGRMQLNHHPPHCIHRLHCIDG